jgi:hypothetical protein
MVVACLFVVSGKIFWHRTLVVQNILTLGGIMLFSFRSNLSKAPLWYRTIYQNFYALTNPLDTMIWNEPAPRVSKTIVAIKNWIDKGRPVRRNQNWRKQLRLICCDCPDRDQCPDCDWYELLGEADF